MRRIIPAGWFVAVTPGHSLRVGRWRHRGGRPREEPPPRRQLRPARRRDDAGHADRRWSPCPPSRDPELFWATAGGMGLTGVVVSATLRLIPDRDVVDAGGQPRFTRLDDLMSAMESTDDRYRYSVAWLDCLGHRDGARRAVLTQGRPRSLRRDPRPPRAGAVGRPPVSPASRSRAPAPRRLANRLSVRALNEAWFRAARPGRPSAHWPRSSTRSTGSGGWNLLYGPDGFVQYQFVVPPETGRRRRGSGRNDRVVRRAVASSPCSSDSVRARPGRSPSPRKGGRWPSTSRSVRRRFPALLDRLDEWWRPPAAASTWPRTPGLRPELLPGDVPPAGRHVAAVCRRVDPEGVLASDLSRRLGIAAVNDAFGHPQSVVVLGGTSDIARVVVDVVGR